MKAFSLLKIGLLLLITGHNISDTVAARIENIKNKIAIIAKTVNLVEDPFIVGLIMDIGILSSGFSGQIEGYPCLHAKGMLINLCVNTKNLLQYLLGQNIFRLTFSDNSTLIEQYQSITKRGCEI